MPEPTILLVEDDPDSRDIYTTVLRHSGFRVLEAADGQEGLELARTHAPSLIVMDLGLPRVDGWRATELLKMDPATRHIPVVAVTVHAQDFYRGRAELAGCDGFIDKPCAPTNLIREIRRLLERA